MRIPSGKVGRPLLVDAGRLPPRCEYHPESPASASCAECHRRLCDGCTTALPGFTLACLACRGTVLARRRRRSRAAAIATAPLAAVALYWVATHVRGPSPRPARVPEQAAPAPSPTVEDGETMRLRAGLEREPCDRVRIVELAERLARRGDNREALDAAARFFLRCGDYPRLRWVTYATHQRLGQWDASIAEVTRLIEHNRYDRDYWVWRGLVYEEKGDFPRAIADYRQALSLEPALANIPFNLANLYERTGRPCEAIFPLEQFVHHYPAIPSAPQVRHRILALYESGNCGDYAAKGRAVVALADQAEGIVAIATVNKRHRGRFLVDTGASYVALSSGFATRLGLPTQLDAVLVRTANGPATAWPVTLDHVALQGASASRVSALVMDSLPESVDGLLGLSFLSRFEVKLDRRHGRLELRAPRRDGSPQSQ